MTKKLLSLSAVFIGILVALNLGYTYRHYNVILITVDTLRADHLSCYNPEAAPTPNIDQLAKKGVLFRNAFSLIPITMPSHTAILSSHPPEELRLFNNGDSYYDRWPLLPDILGDHQYRTAAFISLPVLRGVFGLGHHFDRYEDKFDRYGRYYKVASEVNELALPWIEKERKHRFLAWIHYSDPHEPYVRVDAPPDTEVAINGVAFGEYCFRKKEAVTLKFLARPGETRIEFRSLMEYQSTEPKRFLEKNTTIFPVGGTELAYGAEWRDFVLPNGIPARYFDTSGILTITNKNAASVAVMFRFTGGVKGQKIEAIRRNYAAEVQYTDRYVGLLWQKLVDLNLENKTIIVLTADHGEGLKTHDYLNHINCLYNETIHVPFIIYYPNLGYRGKEVSRMVNHLDIVPTILDLLHIGASNLRGNSLKSYVTFSPIDRLFSKNTSLPRTFSCTYAPQAFVNSFSMVEGRTKLINSPDRTGRQWEMYDLAQDPGETHNLANPDRLNTAEIRTLRAILEDHRNRAEAVHKEYQGPVLNEEDRDMLRALHYVQGGKRRTSAKEEEVP
ncbi:MAG TPA: sulfatase [Acidobacteriota bacterium]|nr:sulfatase [Acidobacteriota bacterium]